MEEVAQTQESLDEQINELEEIENILKKMGGKL